MRYDRYLSPATQTLLGRSQPLNSLLSNISNWVSGDENALDLQFRSGDRLMIYHGTLCLLTVSIRPHREELSISAHDIFRGNPEYDDLMTNWSIDQAGLLLDKLSNFCTTAVGSCPSSHYRNRYEGFWQNRLAQVFGQGWKRGMGWLVFDREAVIGFESDFAKKATLEPLQRKYGEIRSRMQAEDSKTWGAVDGSGFGDEVDLLALGPSHELICIELKHGDNASGIYWGRLQTAVYRDLYRAALSRITDDIKTLVRQKVDLGFLPIDALSRLPAGDFREVVGVLAVAQPNDASGCWVKSGEVLARCSDANIPVVEIRNFNDPSPLPRIL